MVHLEIKCMSNDVNITAFWGIFMVPDLIRMKFQDPEYSKIALMSFFELTQLKTVKKIIEFIGSGINWRHNYHQLSLLSVFNTAN